MSRKPISSDDIDLKTVNALVLFEQGRSAESERLLLESIREARDEVDRYFLYLDYGEILMKIGR